MGVPVGSALGRVPEGTAGPVRSAALPVSLCVSVGMCVCPCVVGGAAGAAAGDPPVPPRRRSGPGAPRCSSCSCSRAPTGPA